MKTIKRNKILFAVFGILLLSLLAGYSFSGPTVSLQTAINGVSDSLTITQTTDTDAAKNIDNTLSDTSTTGHTVYGQYNTIRNDVVVTATAQNLYGERTWVEKSGADTNTDTTTVYGSEVSAKNTGATDAGTKNTYALDLQATGDTAGTSTAYGIRAAASGADTNWAGYFEGDVNVTGTIVSNGGQSCKRTAAGAADYNPSALTTDYIIAMDNTAAARACTISTEDEDTGTTANPRVFIIKDESGVCNINNITISLESGGTIDGAANKVMNQPYQSLTLYVDGTNAFIY